MEFLAPGSVIERYTIEGVLGRGGMAIVYRVRHNQLGTLHAMKVLTVPSRSIRQRLVQEGRLQASMQHPNIVSVNDVVEIDGAPGLLMELIRGPSLDKVLEKQRLTLVQCDALVPGILAGVAAAHARGLVHRDLKPHNIMLAITEQGPIPKITDFGIAKVLEAEAGGGVASATRTGAQMGSPPYMAPEQVRNAKGVDHRADIFALGTILYQMVTGRMTFDGEDLLEIFNAIGSGRYVAPRELVPDLPERMERAILGALVIDREARIPTVETLLAVWRGEEVAPGKAVSRRASGPFDDGMFAEYERPEPTSEKPAPSVADATFGEDLSASMEADSPYDPAEALPDRIPSAGAFAETEARPPMAGQGAPTIAAATPSPAARIAEPPRRWSRVWIVAGLGAVGLLGVAATGTAVMIGVASTWTGEEAPAEPLSAPASVEAPKLPVAAVVEPDVPPPVAVAAADPKPAKAKAKPARSPAPPAGPAVVAPTPEPAAAEEEPAPAPVVASAGPAAGLARVKVEGAARLQDATSRLIDLPADVAPGTYGVYVGTTKMLDLTVDAGEIVSLKCGATKCVRR